MPPIRLSRWPGTRWAHSLAARIGGLAALLLLLGVLVVAHRHGTLGFSAVLAAAALIVGATFSSLLTRRLTATLTALSDHARALAERIDRDETDLAPFESTAKGEVGELAASFNVMVDRLADNIRRRERAEARLVWDAMHDALTGLPNRHLFLDRLERSFRRARRDGDLVCAVLVIDLANMEQIGDRYGLALADRVLVLATGRLQRLLRRNDSLARLGSAQLVVLMDDARSVGDPVMLVRRLLAALGEPFHLAEHVVSCAAHVGVGVLTAAMESAEELLQAADVAARRARERSLGYELCDPALRERALDHIQLHQELTLAIRQRQIGVRYQPIVRIEDGSLAGLEALATWQHPSRGPISPGHFIPLAEQSELIVALGREVLRCACGDVGACREWLHPDLAHVHLSINVSARQLSRADLVDDILGVLRDHRISPSRLVVEITEGALVDEPDAAVEVLRALQHEGIRFHIDDFGTGYASMAYLQRFPCHAIKLDRSFVAGMLHDPSSLEIVRSGIALAHRLAKQVIAEGVESHDQLAMLRSLGCDYAQGFLFGSGLPRADAALQAFQSLAATAD